MRPPEKTREWERQRRDRLNEGFSSLLKEIPELAASENASKLKILQTAASYIKRLRELVAESASPDERGCRKCNFEVIVKQDRAVQVDVPARFQGIRSSAEANKLSDDISHTDSETTKILRNVSSAQDESFRTFRLARNKQLLTSKRSIRQLHEILSENLANQNLKSVNNTPEKVDGNQNNQLVSPPQANQPMLVISSSSGSVVILTSTPTPKLGSGVGRPIFPKHKLPCSRLVPSRRTSSRIAVKRKAVAGSKSAKKRKLNSEATKQPEKRKDSAPVVTPAEDKRSAEKSNSEANQQEKTTKEVPVSEHNFSITSVLQPQQSKANDTVTQVTTENQAQPISAPQLQQTELAPTSNDVSPATHSVYTYPSCYYANSKADHITYSGYQNYYDYSAYNSFSYDPSHFSSYNSTCLEQPLGVVATTNGSEQTKETAQLEKPKSGKVNKPIGRVAEMAQPPDKTTFTMPSAKAGSLHTRQDQCAVPVHPVEEPQITELVNATPESVSYHLLGQFHVAPETTNRTTDNRNSIQATEQSKPTNSDISGKVENKFSQIQNLARTSNPNPNSGQAEQLSKPGGSGPQNLEKNRLADSSQKGKTTNQQGSHVFPTDGNKVTREPHVLSQTGSQNLLSQSHDGNMGTRHPHSQSQFISHAIGNLIEKTRDSSAQNTTEYSCNKDAATLSRNDTAEVYRQQAPRQQDEKHHSSAQGMKQEQPGSTNTSASYNYENQGKDASCQQPRPVVNKTAANVIISSNNCNITHSNNSHAGRTNTLANSSSCTAPSFPTHTNSLSQAWTAETTQKQSEGSQQDLQCDSKCKKSQRILSVSQLVEQPKTREQQKPQDKAEKGHSLSSHSISTSVAPATSSVARERQVSSTFSSSTSTHSAVFSSSHSISSHTSTSSQNQAIPSSSGQATSTFVQQPKSLQNQHKQATFNEFDRNQSYKSYSRGYCAYSAEALINQDYGSSEQFRNQQPYSQWSYNQQYFPTSTTVNAYNKSQSFNDNSQYQQFQFADQSFYPQSHHQLGHFTQDMNTIAPNADSVGDSSSFFQYSSDVGRSGCTEKQKTKETRQPDTQHSYYPEHGTLTVPLPSFSSILEDVSFAAPTVGQSDVKSNKSKGGTKQEKQTSTNVTAVSWTNSIPTATYNSSDETKRSKKETKQNQNAGQSKKSLSSWNSFGNSYQSSGSSNFNVSNIIPEIRYSNTTRHTHEIGNFQLNTDYGVSFPTDISSGYMSHQNMHLGHSLPTNFKPMDFNFSPVVPPAPPFGVPHASANFKSQQITK